MNVLTYFPRTTIPKHIVKMNEKEKKQHTQTNYEMKCVEKANVTCFLLNSKILSDKEPNIEHTVHHAKSCTYGMNGNAP